MDINIKHRLIKYFSDSCTDEERKQIEQWRDESIENKLFYDKTKLFWDTMGRLKKEEKFDAEETWERVAKKMDKRKYSVALKVAVSAVIVALLSFLFSSFFDNKEMEQKQIVVAPDNEVNINEEQVVPKKELFTNRSTLKQELPDGSRLMMNKNSYVSYHNFMEDSIRTVRMNGEVFFQVKKSKKPFLVKTDDVNILVHGTSFNVNTFKRKKTIEVKVYEGQVTVSDSNDRTNKVLLSKGEKCRYQTKDKRFVKNKFKIGRTWFGNMVSNFSNLFKKKEKKS